jgi:hypothetical protein
MIADINPYFESSVPSRTVQNKTMKTTGSLEHSFSELFRRKKKKQFEVLDIYFSILNLSA